MNMVNEMKRETKLINLRAFLILSVVMGHSIILYSGSWNVYESIYEVKLFEILKKIIGFYQMPIFFSLSGYLFYYTCLKKKKIIPFVWDKIKRLIIPFICITTLWITPIKMLLDVPSHSKYSFIEYLYRNIILLKSTGHLWFLVTLFIIFIIFYILNRVFDLTEKDKKHFIIDVVLVAILGVVGLKVGFFKSLFPQTAIYRTVTYLLWFYMGFLICKYLSLGKKCDAYKHPLVPYISMLTGALIIWGLSHGGVIVKFGLRFLMILTAYLIIPSKTNKFTEFIDKNSMGMFLFHSVFIYISFTFWKDINPFLMVFINFVLFGGASILMTILIRKTPFKFMIGESK